MFSIDLNLLLDCWWICISLCMCSLVWVLILKSFLFVEFVELFFEFVGLV